MCCVVDNSYDKIIKLPPMVVRATRIPPAQSTAQIQYILTQLKWTLTWNIANQQFDTTSEDVPVGTLDKQPEPPKETPPAPATVQTAAATGPIIVIGGRVAQQWTWTYTDGHTETFTLYSIGGSWYYPMPDGTWKWNSSPNGTDPWVTSPPPPQNATPGPTGSTHSTKPGMLN